MTGALKRKMKISRFSAETRKENFPGQPEAARANGRAAGD